MKIPLLAASALRLCDSVLDFLKHGGPEKNVSLFVIPNAKRRDHLELDIRMDFSSASALFEMTNVETLCFSVLFVVRSLRDFAMTTLRGSRSAMRDIVNKIVFY